VHEALALARLVRVVVHPDQVAHLVECRLLHIAVAAGVDLETGPVGLHPQRRALVGKHEPPTFARGDVHALVADRPVDAAVGPNHRPVHVVTRVRDVQSEAADELLALIGDAIVIDVAEPPQVGRDGGVDPAVVPEDARGDAGHLGVEALREDRDAVGRAVAVGVAQLVDALSVVGEVLPVDRAVAVVVAEPAARRAQPAGSEFPAEKLGLFLDRSEPHVVRDPHRVLADVEVADLAPGRRRDVGVAGLVERDGRRVRHVERPRPLGRLHLGGGPARGGREQQGAAEDEAGRIHRDDYTLKQGTEKH